MSLFQIHHLITKRGKLCSNSCRDTIRTTEGGTQIVSPPPPQPLGMSSSKSNFVLQSTRGQFAIVFIPFPPSALLICMEALTKCNKNWEMTRKGIFVQVLVWPTSSLLPHLPCGQTNQSFLAYPETRNTRTHLAVSRLECCGVFPTCRKAE